MSSTMVVSREEWGADSPTTAIKYSRQDYPVDLVYVTLKSGLPDCQSRDECITALKVAQKKVMATDKSQDIPYSFVIASDGTVYEGRGWEVKPDKAVAMQEVDFDPRAYDIAFFGDYSDPNNDVPIMLIKAMVDFLDGVGVKKKYLFESYDLEPFRGGKFQPSWYPGEEEMKKVKPIQGKEAYECSVEIRPRKKTGKNKVKNMREYSFTTYAHK